MERILSREAPLIENHDEYDQWKVGVTGISKSAGTSFLTGCLARYLANTGRHSPAVVELGKGSLYDSFGMDKRFAGRAWNYFYSALQEKKIIRGWRNMDEGINWVIRTPEEEKINLSFEQKLRLISHTRGDVILCDVPAETDQDCQLLLCMDRIIAVIDPMPSKMLEGYNTLSRLKALETDKREIIFVINKMNRGVNRRQLLDFLSIKKPLFLPLISPELIYTAEYNCRIPYAIGEVKTALRAPFGELTTAMFFCR